MSPETFIQCGSRAMSDSVFVKSEFILLVATSVLLPLAIYVYMLVTRFISRWTVLSLAAVLIGLSAVDIILLQHLVDMARKTPSTLDDKLFTTGLSISLYLLPAVFAGLGVNLLSHVLTSHLAKAARASDPDRPCAENG